MSDAFYLLDRDWRFAYLNSEALRLLRRSSVELLGVEVWTAFPEARESALFHEYTLAVATREVRCFELFYPQLDTWFEVDAHPSDDGLAVYFRSVTTRRLLEARLRDTQRLESIGELSGGMAHDFNNLLTVIMGNTGLLHEALTGDERLLPLVKSIDDAARRGADLTQRMLAFARRQTLDPELSDVNALIESLGVLLERTVGPTVVLKVVPAEAAWPVMVDVSQLENSLINLSLNARDAMPAGGTLVIETANVSLADDYARARADIAGGDYVCIAVSDSGCGIPRSLRERIFEPFFTTKDKGRGTGLGLSMVFGFIKQSGGHISVYSEPGEGTTFRLYLPRAPGVAHVLSRSARDHARPLSGTERILVVEDDEHVRGQLVGILERAGYNVLEAADATQALAVLENGVAVDLLLTDVMMPGGMNGPQLVEAARGICPGLPVLFSSGYAEKAALLHGRVPDTTHFQPKPYHPDELLAKLREVFNAA